MRLHSLEIQGFGPFAATATVDFDALSTAGLFLLSGATGAGKTSVLDAVCFALYGDVPGDRSSAKRLRADQAEAGLAPRVSLEATLAGRRFRFVRSPSWDRPKKRGAGTTTEQASVVVSEKMRGDWVTLSTRLDEAGQLVSGLVGMTLTQFTQVAMLPQGRFQTFLRARSEERHQLLQQLFRTGRFHDVERWLREHRLELRRRASAAHDDVADLVSRLSESADAALPGQWDLHDLAGPAREGGLATWVGGLVDAAEEQVLATASAVTEAAVEEGRTRSALEEAADATRRRERHRRALADHRVLLDQAHDHTAAVRRLDDARRAAPVLPALRAVDTATLALTRAEAAWVGARSALVEAGHPGAGHLDMGVDTSAAGLDEVRDRVAHELASARALQPRARELHRWRTSTADLRRREAALGADATGLAERLDLLPGLVTDAEVELAAADAADRLLLVLRPEREQVAARLAAHRLAERLDVELVAARRVRARAHEHVLAAREHWLGAREARLDSMAAEIAGALVVGASCPVCGSCDHPQRATAGPGVTGAEAEAAARALLDSAQADEYARDEHVRGLAQQLVTAREATGEASAAELADARADGDQRIAAAEPLARGLTRRRETLRALTTERDALHLRRSETAVARATLASQREAAESAAAVLSAELAAVLDDTAHDGLDDLVGALAARLRSLEAAARAGAELEHRTTGAEEARAAAERALAEAGFDDVALARDAALPHDDTTRLAAQVAEHDRRLVAVETVLAEFADDPDPDTAPPPPDLDVLGAAHRDAVAVLGDTTGRAGRAHAVRSRLHDLGTRLRQAVAVWTPLDDDLELATRVSAFADGRSADNRLQMRLSAYVLAHRLGQVVAAANERLASMSDQRYSLEHTAQRGAGETRGGLSLLVRDDWSGESRDPATLSGGETFVVSLALALGLAHVITQEAGGADLDTLFVDEGFGSLDADTLDDVMDTLDTLRDGGRVVGVVSHVAEMRDRIPTRLLVAKSRTGSTLSQVP